MKVKFCPNCGSQLEENTKFCGNCGMKINNLEIVEKHKEEKIIKQEEVNKTKTTLKDEIVPDKRKTIDSELVKSNLEKVLPDNIEEKKGLVKTELQEIENQIDKIGKDISNSITMEKINSNGILQNIKNKYFPTKRRINRKPYFWRGMMLGLVVLVGYILSMSIVLAIIGVPMILLAMISSTMIAICRLHDLNKSGWWIIIGYIPYVNIIVGLYLLFVKGTNGTNKYGEDPLVGKY